jgi:hypothetical protein
VAPRHKVEAASNKLTKGASNTLYPLLNSSREEVLERAESLGMGCLAILNNTCHCAQAVIDSRNSLLNGNCVRILLHSYCQGSPDPELKYPVFRGLEKWGLEYRVPWELYTPEY